jgi:hypothetical protein
MIKCNTKYYTTSTQLPAEATCLTFILIMWTFGRAPNNASKWEMGFNSLA